MADLGNGLVVAVSADAEHRFSKPVTAEIMLLEGLGVAGDAHAGVTVQHLHRIRIDPTQPNLRQVHLIRAEVHDELAGRGFEVAPGGMGEGRLIRKAGVMGVVRTGGPVRPGDRIGIEWPSAPHRPLEPV